MVTASVVSVLLAAAAGCDRTSEDTRPRASGYVEATEVRVAAQVGGRVLEMRVAEGDRLAAGDLIARLDTADALLAVARLEAERAQADAQLRLAQAGARREDIRQAGAQADSSDADVHAATAEQQAAAADVQRFEALLAANAGSRKQRDDAVTRRDVASARVTAARERARAAQEGVARLRAGSRPQEIAAARARVAAVDAQIASLRKTIDDAEVKAPVAGLVTLKLIDGGETIAPGTPLIVVTDLAHAWANLYVDEPLVPQLKIGQTLTLTTDGGQTLPGTITFISPKAEFTPRNVQTAEERSKLVYRIKVTTDNNEGVLKTGMPVVGRF
ncbi:MAG: HlyD family efflux transporter periplasmic adaptor subunit [Vicinamibacterales bacterium]